MSVSIADISWAAGFIEGEGCFWASKKRPDIVVSVTQLQRWPLEKLETLLGGFIYVTKRKVTGEKDVYCWRIGNSMAIGLMFTLFSLMSPKRCEQIKKAVAVWKTRNPHSRFKQVCSKGHPFSGDNLNLWISKDGMKHRRCRACRLIESKNQNEKRKEKRKAIAAITTEKMP